MEATIDLKALESNAKTAQATLDEATSAYKALLAQGPDVDIDVMQPVMNQVVAARKALKDANAAIDKANANQRWMELVNVNRGVMTILDGVTLADVKASPTALNGNVTIKEDGTVESVTTFAWKLPTPDEIKAAVIAFVTANKAEYAKRKVSGLNFKLTAREDGTGFEASVSPVGISDGTAKPKATGKGAASGGGKGSNEYVSPDGVVHTAREAIAALRSSYSGKQESIDNALTTGNAVRNIAVALCNANGWTIRKAS